MRVINKPNKPEVWPKTVMCPHCGCEIEYDEHDLEDVDGGIGFDCPNCEETIVTEEIELHKFPDSFYHFGKEGSAILSNETTQKMVDETVDFLEDAEIGNYYFTGTGDTIVFGFKHEDESIVHVCKNYWEEHYDFKD